MRPTEIKYARTHEWAKLDGDTVTVGITDFAVEQLTDLTYIDLPDVGDVLRRGEGFGQIESVKAVSDLYSPCAGEVIAINTELTEKENFELLAKDPFGAGWLIKLKISDPADLTELLDADSYKKFADESEED